MDFHRLVLNSVSALYLVSIGNFLANLAFLCVVRDSALRDYGGVEGRFGEAEVGELGRALRAVAGVDWGAGARLAEFFFLGGAMPPCSRRWLKKRGRGSEGGRP